MHKKNSEEQNSQTPSACRRGNPQNVKSCDLSLLFSCAVRTPNVSDNVSGSLMTTNQVSAASEQLPVHAGTLPMHASVTSPFCHYQSINQ